ncbi:GDSL-type esterase/lipase family protein [Mechercharimyces sp. CAU 1602]|uniref:SGNH/GDSL hydrolase family protein n=1 Tax=Mechercharimyces sp. CAU 1602 TaxID=2973933 RepID=UPI0021611A63|nr:GDSL-type esterase/lipase family protein [Mechercharimyces sp. CAU 1602]MCS1350735.1 GDSL-type esterase/lipase family protein [Mechercharimyces sp. CAU 1602]
MSNPYIYTALGDSITAGYSAPMKFGFVDMFYERLQGVYPESQLYNFSKGGITSSQLFAHIRRSYAVQSSISKSSLITITIGGNDLMRSYVKTTMLQQPYAFYQAKERFAYNINGILSWLRYYTEAPIYFMNLYNPYPHSLLSRQQIGEYNAVINEYAIRWNTNILDLYTLFYKHEATFIHGYQGGGLTRIRIIGENPVHPNTYGHAAIADLMWQRAAI